MNSIERQLSQLLSWIGTEIVPADGSVMTVVASNIVFSPLHKVLHQLPHLDRPRRPQLWDLNQLLQILGCLNVRPL